MEILVGAAWDADQLPDCFCSEMVVAEIELTNEFHFHAGQEFNAPVFELAVSECQVSDKPALLVEFVQT